MEKFYVFRSAEIVWILAAFECELSSHVYTLYMIAVLAWEIIIRIIISVDCRQMLPVVTVSSFNIISCNCH